MAEIVNEADFLDDEEDVRIVRLTSTYAYDIAELYANISPRQVRLRRISSDKQPKTATFSASEMDVLTEAWTQFKADRQAALDAEEARQQEVLRTALALAGSVDGIHIEKDEALEDYHSYSYNPPRPGWKVTHPGTSSTKAYFYPDGLLDGVHLMITEWGEHLLEKQKALDDCRRKLQGGDESKWVLQTVEYNRGLLDKYGHALEQIKAQGIVLPSEDEVAAF